MSLLLALALQAAALTGHDCQATIGPLYDGPDIASLPNQVDGSAVGGVEGLAALRASRGTAPIIVNGGNFGRADFRRARLANICFVGSDLTGSDWRGVEAPGMAFVDSNLEGANLAGARLPRVLLRQPNLKNVDATGADLSGGKLDGGWDGSVENWRLDRANLRGFRFDCSITIGDGCPIDGDLRWPGADLTGASLSSYFRYSRWAGARLDRTELSLAQLTQIDGANIQGPILVRGGDTVVEISAADLRSLRPHIGEVHPEPQASFDCRNARTIVERQICAPDSGNLRQLDSDLAERFRAALAANRALASEQQAWLRERDRCGADDACLDSRYRERIDRLIASMGPPNWARPGTYALFVQPELAFDEEIRAQPIYRRLLPVLIDGASARAVFRFNADGTIDAAGDAVGANAHLCSLAAEGLRLERATGWYSARPEDTAQTPARLRGRPVPVVRLYGDRLEVYRSGHADFEEDPRPGDYASCGARAYFDEMVRVPVTAEEGRILLDSLREQ